ncbi:hypothetical protein ACFL6D_02285 [Spirochaetota bacterium]
MDNKNKHRGRRKFNKNRNNKKGPNHPQRDKVPSEERKDRVQSRSDHGRRPFDPKEEDRKIAFKIPEEYQRIFKKMEVNIDELMKNKTCPLCQKDIIDYYTTMNHKAHNQRAHIQCIADELARRENLRKDENICYMGNGSFAICSYHDLRGRYRFFIRKRIQYEERKVFPHRFHEDEETPRY